MKKIIITLVSLLICTNVYAIECSEAQLNEASSALENLTYNLKYNKDYTDMNGNITEGYFNISFPNLPSGYEIEIDTYEAMYEIKSPSDFGYASGGVVKVDVYSNACEDIVKTFEIKVPFYKQNYLFGNLDGDDVWYDGTSDIRENEQSEEKKNPLTLKLVIALIVLIIIVVGLIIFLIRKRRFDEENL